MKDRVIAQYLKAILQEQVKLRKESQPNNANLLDARYAVDMAMGPRGKNLVNKAYKSTKPADVAEIFDFGANEDSQS